MDAKKILLSIIVLFTMISLTGCEEQAVTTETPENVIFESDVVQLDAANLNFIKDDEEFDARQVILNYRLHNPLNRSLIITVDVIFFDETDRELYSKLDYKINLPPEYTESFNSVEFGGNRVKFVEYAKITAYEIQE